MKRYDHDDELCAVHDLVEKEDGQWVKFSDVEEDLKSLARWNHWWQMQEQKEAIAAAFLRCMEGAKDE